MEHYPDAMKGPDWVWRWPSRGQWDYALGYYREGQRWEFSGRGYGTSGYWTPIGAFIGWLRFYRKAMRFRREQTDGL